MHSFMICDPNSDRMKALRRSLAAQDVDRRPSLQRSPQAGLLSGTGVSYPAQKTRQAGQIVAALTLKQKVALCSGRDMWYLKSIQTEHHQLSAVMITDGPHGIRKQQAGDSTDFLTDRVPATCFPTASCLACSWDAALLKQMGVALGTECVNEDITVLLGPGMNIKRHPAGGRNFEYLSEDPVLTAGMASALVEGIQSRGVGTSIKHVAVNNEELWRMRMDVKVDERTCRELYWRAFELTIRNKTPQKQPWTIMCAYNKMNGTYCSEHSQLWKMVREEWGFSGLVMTDWGATNDRVAGLLAGVDLEMPGSQGAYDSQLMDAVKTKKIPMETLDATVTRNVALSLVGQDVMDTVQEVDYDAHHELARKVAMESVVLLKNENNLLPLAKNTSIAVIGNFAKKPRYQGMGSSQVFPTKVDCAWDRLHEHTDKLIYATGYNRDNDKVDKNLVSEAVAAAKEAAVAIIFGGLPESYESEGFDRPHMEMPDNHNVLIDEVCDANPQTVVVLANGAPVTMPWVDKARAVMEGYLSGQAGGSALADLIFGVASPCGKLAETFPLSQSDHASDANFPGKYYEVQYREGLNVGYRHFDSAGLQVLFPFGHGLSYTKFEYRSLQTTVVLDDVQVRVKFTICNVGSVRAAEIAQCYVHDVESTVYRPEQELKAFSKVWLNAGEEQQVEFTLEKQAFSFYDVGAKDWVVEPGAFEIRVGASSRDLPLRSTIEISVGQAPSARARQAHPPVKHAAGRKVADQEFARMLGVDSLPAPSTRARPFHNNTLIGELKSSLLGQIVRRAVFRGAAKGMEDPNDELQKKLMREICENIPMRGLVIFSQGGITFEELTLMLATMNWRILKVCGQYWPVLKERKRRLDRS